MFISNQELMLAIVFQWTLDLTFMSSQLWASMQKKYSFILALFWMTHKLWKF